MCKRLVTETRWMISLPGARGCSSLSKHHLLPAQRLQYPHFEGHLKAHHRLLGLQPLRVPENAPEGVPEPAECLCVVPITEVPTVEHRLQVVCDLHSEDTHESAASALSTVLIVSQQSP